MKIYLIKHERHGYDWYLGHVIVANNEDEVRDAAKQICAGEGDDIWNDAELTIEGEYTGTNTEPFVMLSDFNAA